MTVKERLLLLLIALVVGGLGFATAIVALALVSSGQVMAAVGAVHGNFKAVLLALLLLALALTLLVFALRRGQREENLLQEGPLGEVRICFKAMESIVLRAARGVQGVRDTKTKIVNSDDGLIIFLRSAVFPDTIIPETTAVLQKAVKEYVEKSTGNNVAEVKIMIENVAGEQGKTVR